jgi:alpha-tubulin suppressor-like RCC1 family protein
MSIIQEPDFVHGIHTDVVDVACGDNFWIALDKQGNVYTFGNAKTGVLGVEKAKKHTVPTIVPTLSGKKISSIHAGWKHVAVIVEE